MKPICCFVSMVLVAVAPGPSLAQTANGPMATAEIKLRVAQANAKDQRLIVLLKTGKSISGAVSPQSDTSFSVTTVSHGVFGEGQTVLVNYADVASVRGRNPFVRALKRIGSVSLTAAGVAAFMPVWLALEGLSFLLHGEGLPSC